MLNCAEQGQIQKYKTHAYNLITKHSKQVSKLSSRYCGWSLLFLMIILLSPKPPKVVVVVVVVVIIIIIIIIIIMNAFL